ncbi:single-stranded-DNA-specific exonuclease RecJ [Candidatus Woesebacteria bacterium]|nr:single-stranded-DNA-specific exonuclease RecJ [Candidatus Woesebacteria bacterium]
MNITYNAQLSEKKSAEEIVALLLKDRGVDDTESFLHPTSPLAFSLKTFGYEKEGKKLIALLHRVRKNNERIVVYTDYDADGITGGTIMWETLHLLGFDVMPYVPDRKTEGYGFSKTGIDRVKELYDPSLIISVDHGITAVEQIAYAAKLGIDVVVTDHHHKQEQIPKKAQAIIHIPELSGSGVAYFVAKEIYNQSSEQRKNNKTLERNFAYDYMAIATIGLVADLVALKGRARSLVYHGLKAFPHVKRPGITAMLKQAGIEDKPVTPYEIGFIIAPRINAVGRLENAIEALRLLCTTDTQRAGKLARKLNELNTKRQDMVKQSVEQAERMVQKQYGDNIPNIIILFSPDWHEGIIGLIASALVEKYYRPTIVMSQDTDHLKGSARSISAFHITHFFERLSSYFINFGGHAQAGGFALPVAKRDAFIKEATKKAQKLITPEDLERAVTVDLKLPLGCVSMKLVRTLEKCAPFGIGNPRPRFASAATVVDYRLIGKNKNHLKLRVHEPNGSFLLDCIGFSMPDHAEKIERGDVCEIIYTLDVNRWNGRESLQGKLINIIST